MGKYRDRLQIIADILAVISNSDAKKTRIMYLANLSWDLLTRYLNDLKEAGLVRCGRSDCYVLTAKGERFLSRFLDYHQTRIKVEAQLEDVNGEKEMLENMCSNTKKKRGSQD